MLSILVTTALIEAALYMTHRARQGSLQTIAKPVRTMPRAATIRAR